MLRSLYFYRKFLHTLYFTLFVYSFLIFYHVLVTVNGRTLSGAKKMKDSQLHIGTCEKKKRINVSSFEFSPYLQLEYLTLLFFIVHLFFTSPRQDYISSYGFIPWLFSFDFSYYSLKVVFFFYFMTPEVLYKYKERECLG